MAVANTLSHLRHICARQGQGQQAGDKHKVIAASRPRHALRACSLGKNLRGSKRPAWPYYIFLLHRNKKVLAKEMPLPILRFVAVQHFTVEV